MAMPPTAIEPLPLKDTHRQDQDGDGGSPALGEHRMVTGKLIHAVSGPW